VPPSSLLSFLLSYHHLSFSPPSFLVLWLLQLFLQQQLFFHFQVSLFLLLLQVSFLVVSVTPTFVVQEVIVMLLPLFNIDLS